MIKKGKLVILGDGNYVFENNTLTILDSGYFRIGVIDDNNTHFWVRKDVIEPKGDEAKGDEAKAFLYADLSTGVANIKVTNECVHLTTLVDGIRIEINGVEYGPILKNQLQPIKLTSLRDAADNVVYHNYDFWRLDIEVMEILVKEDATLEAQADETVNIIRREPPR